MAQSGGQPGNKNASRGTDCRQALKRALSRKSKATFREGLDIMMDQYVDAACAGDLRAIIDIFDRLDGKAIQAIDMQALIDIDRDWTVNGGKVPRA